MDCWFMLVKLEGKEVNFSASHRWCMFQLSVWIFFHVYMHVYMLLPFCVFSTFENEIQSFVPSSALPNHTWSPAGSPHDSPNASPGMTSSASGSSYWSGGGLVVLVVVAVAVVVVVVIVLLLLIVVFIVVVVVVIAVVILVVVMVFYTVKHGKTHQNIFSS